MEPSHVYVRTLSRLVHLLQQPTSTTEEVRETLRLLAAQAREHDVRLDATGPRLVVDDEPVADSQGVEPLVERLRAHRVRQLVLRRYATATELVKIAKLLADPPAGDAGALERLAAAHRLWNVTVVAGAAPGDVVPLAALPAALQATVAHLQARVRGAALAIDAEHALDALVELAERQAAAGAAEAVAAVLVGIVRAEAESASRAVRAACGAAIERLARPAVTRLVAQRLPPLAGRGAAYASHLEAIGRCGTAGAAALLAHIMAAETLQERRVFYDAIVALRAGIPMLIDALGRPQWFVVRNAACMLGEMAAGEADAALARLLDHDDERVREAAAGALARQIGRAHV